MSSADRRRYDEIEAFLAGSPYPIRGTDYITDSSMFGWTGFRYFDQVFPYSIFYEVDEHEITVTLVLRSATNLTPL